MTLRQCFYRLAVTGVIPNTAAAYRKLSAHLAEARRRANFPDRPPGRIGPDFGARESILTTIR
ncbi:hypothetical protein ACWEPL_32030 [Nonomuraea sp. NPDC004186]